MALNWSDSLERIDWEELSRLYWATPLGSKNPSDLKTVFSNSVFRCLAYDYGPLAGVGRALADGVDCSYICDVAVLPSHQGLGLVKEIIVRLINLSRGHKKIIPYAVSGKQPSYCRLGFKRISAAMAIFDNQELALERGYFNET